MTALLLVSHSPKIAEGVRELAFEMAGEAEIAAVGGTAAGTLGADYDGTAAALERLTSGGGNVIVLSDLGSARMTVQMAAEALPEEARKRVFHSDAAFVEGGLIAAVALAGQLEPAEVLEQLKQFNLPKE
jgi:dihydroxyacetone kinase phosphotransfer subunit